MKALTLILVLVSGWTYTQMGHACSENGKSGFLPENDLHIPVGFKSLDGGLSQAQFNHVIAKVKKIYDPIVSNMGGRFEVERLWDDTTVNAYAKRDTPSVWTVQMFGGLARHPAITQDGFTLVLCHELGHHIGGAPKKRDGMNPWAGSEGQSDYFATLKCLRRVFLNDNNDAIVKKLEVPATLAKACKANHSNEDVSICIRSGMAGASVAALFSSIGQTKSADFSTPDRTVVSSNVDSHPDTQCRLDTFFQGAVCEVSFNEDVSQKDEIQGTCHQVLGHKIGLRPRCWHKPVTH
jgi:hypothetical protein